MWRRSWYRAMPDDGQLVDAIGEIAPDDRTRQLMLVDNPAALFRFATR